MMNEEKNSIEDKRRKNVLDNQKFLETLNLINVRDDFKSIVKIKAKPIRKEKIQPSELRRSSRIKTLVENIIHNENDDSILSTDDEDEKDLTAAFTAKIDDDWKPLRRDHLSIAKHIRPVKRMPRPTTTTSGVKIYHPNIGLQASKVISEGRFHENRVTKKMNVAISSSDED